jgi:hypothetical protein
LVAFGVVNTHAQFRLMKKNPTIVNEGNRNKLIEYVHK